MPQERQPQPEPRCPANYGSRRRLCIVQSSRICLRLKVNSVRGVRCRLSCNCSGVSRSSRSRSRLKRVSVRCIGDRLSSVRGSLQGHSVRGAGSCNCRQQRAEFCVSIEGGSRSRSCGCSRLKRSSICGVSEDSSSQGGSRRADGSIR